MLLHLFDSRTSKKRSPIFFAYKKQGNPLSIHYKIGCLLAGILYRHEPPVTVVDTATYPLRNTPPNTGGMVMVG